MFSEQIKTFASGLIAGNMEADKSQYIISYMIIRYQPEERNQRSGTDIRAMVGKRTEADVLSDDNTSFLSLIRSGRWFYPGKRSAIVPLLSGMNQ